MLDGLNENATRRRVSHDDFKRLAGSWASGVAVVTTTSANGHPHGLALSAATSLSLDPMQFLVCIDNRSTTLPALLESGVFGINMLAHDQADISRLFAGKSADKFRGMDFTSIGGVPRIAGTLGFVRCDVAQVLKGGDHKIIIGDVTDIDVGSGAPLVYFRGDYRHIPHAC